ncbi:MAG: mechanosensitive ion channel [Clostridia bacterium]|nr:mechanosensitive ion channel [Clostridia bacterium]
MSKNDLTAWGVANKDNIILGIFIVLIVSVVIPIILHLIFGLFRKSISKRFPKIDRVQKQLKSPIYSLLVITGIYLGLKTMKFPVKIDNFIGGLYKALIICIFAWLLSNLSLFLAKALLKKTDIMNETAVIFASNFMKIIIVAIATVMIISELGYNINGLITGLGLGGLTLSLAAKSTAQNFFASFSLASNKAFYIGDWIETPFIKGTVEDLNMKNTKIRTADGALATVPNAKLADDVIINYSKLEKRRVVEDIIVSRNIPKETLENAVTLIKEAIEKVELTVDILVGVNSFDDNAVKIELIYFIKGNSYDKYFVIMNEVNLEIKKVLEQLNIPQSELIIKNI